MSGDYHHLPIQPASHSLASHLQALDLLAARLDSLNTQSEWETRVPLNSKASIRGSVVNTANVKINVGGEWWVDMTASEGEAWVRRRKAALLEEHAKVLEGWRPGLENRSSPREGTIATPRQAVFDPLFRAPDEAKAMPLSSADPSVEQSHAIAKPVAGKGKAESSSAPAGKASTPVREAPAVIEPMNALAGPSKVAPTTHTPKSLAHALSEFMEKQNALSRASGLANMPAGSAQDAMINDEGLPIHEIREDEDGRLLSELPETDGDGDAQEIKAAQMEEKDDFWSPEAVARREALRRKVFDDPSDSDTESEPDEESPPAQRRSAPPASQHSITSTPSIVAIPPSPTSFDAAISSPPPASARRPSVTATAPKSILKSSAPRKKSVSFDSSLPDSPPDQPTKRIGGSLFPSPSPVPVINIETMMEERTIPTLNAPKRSPKQSTFGSEPFAGFKPGFLGGRSGSPSTSPVVSEPKSAASTLHPAPTSASASSEVKEIEPPKKSLFAQRILEAELDDVTSPNFPAMSTATHTSSVKNAVMERPTQVPPGVVSRVASQPKASGSRVTAGLASTVTERPVSTSGPSRSSAEPAVLEVDDNQYDSNSDYDEEDDDFYRDDDEEEYDLDDALLAREVALAYHQNRAYSQLGQQEARALRGDEDAPYLPDGMEDDGEGGEGGVMLALPGVSMVPDGNSPGSSMPSIINPTPDNLRRFVRVGKLDNGKLVLAPGESGWSDEEADQAGDDGNAEALSSRARNKEDIRRALLGQGPVREVGERVRPATKRDQGLDMPPSVGNSRTQDAGATATATTPAVNTSATPAMIDAMPVPAAAPTPAPAASSTPTEPTKKVSRFKAARMG